MKSSSTRVNYRFSRLNRGISTFVVLVLFLWGGLYSQEDIVRQADSATAAPRVRQVEKQGKAVFAFHDSGVYFSNNFDGARLNAVTQTGKSDFIVTINPENEPVNFSPWYAFKVWSKRSKEINIKLIYPPSYKHRYHPKISKDGRRWSPLAAERLTEEGRLAGEYGPQTAPITATMRLRVGKRALWISGQELETSKSVFAWIDRMARKPFVRDEVIGTSIEGRPLRMLTIGKKKRAKMMLVISRQHPPEVTGYFAMKSFVETIAGNTDLARRFRDKWSVNVIPLMNPDGVDAGHWRHNMGGVDLNRDWTKFTQPETLAVSEFIKKRERETGGKFYFGIDFHSTWNDIYYPMGKNFTSVMPHLVFDWLAQIKQAIPGYEPKIQPNEKAEPAIVSRNYFFVSHGMEALVFEIGDNNSREFIKTKGRVGAVELMKLMLDRE